MKRKKLDSAAGDVDGLEEFFLQARAAQGPTSGKTRVGQGPGRERAGAVLERVLEDAWAEHRRAQGFTHGVFALQKTTRCTVGQCTGERLQNVRIIFLVTRPEGARGESVPSSSALAAALRPGVRCGKAHVCSSFCLHAPGSAVAAAAPGRGSCEEGEEMCRKIFLCRRHVKVHVCGETCQETYKDSMGFAKCILSGLTIAQAEGFSFTDGTRSVWDDGSGQGTVAPRRSTGFLRKPAALGQKPSSNPNSVVPAFPSDTHDDTPCSGLFPGSRLSNTFGEGLAATLDELYEVSWRAAWLLLFSDARGALEVRRLEALAKEAKRRVSGTLLEDLKAGKWVFLDKVMHTYVSVMRSKRVHSGVLLLPQHAKARLNAYYAMVLLEFTVNLFSLCDDLRENEELSALVSRGNRAACGLTRIPAYDSAAFAVNCLTLLVSDFSGPPGAEDVIFPNAHIDPVLGMLPESSTVDKLGVSEKICTDIKKDVKYALTMAKKMDPHALGALQATTLPLRDLYYGKNGTGQRFSVVREFLQKRAARQRAEEEAEEAEAEKTRALLRGTDL